MTQSDISNRYGKSLNIILFAILAFVAFGLRLHYISDMEWNYDEQAAVSMAGDLLRGDYIRLLVGMGSSVGVPNPPGFIVIIASLKLILSDPLLIAIAIAILNSAAVILFAWYMRDKIGVYETWAASFLFASAPWAVIFSRKIWAQDLLAPFTVLLIVGLTEVILRRRPAFWLLVIFSIFMLMQIHFSSIFLLPALAVILFIERNKLERNDLKYILYGGAVASFLFAPFVIILLRNFNSAIANIKASRIENITFMQKTIESVKAFAQSCTGLFYNSTLFEDYSKYVDYAGLKKVIMADSAYYLMTIFLAAGFMILLLKSRTDQISRFLTVIILCHLLFILMVSSRTGLPYFVILYPIPFVMIAMTLKRMPAGHIIGTILLIMIVLVNINWTLTFQGFVRKNNGSTRGYGVPYRVQIMNVNR